MTLIVSRQIEINMKLFHLIENTRRRMSEKRYHYYFSYGMLCDRSNMTGPGVEYIGTAELNDYRLELLAHANIIPAPGDNMNGVLWKITPEVLRKLDNIEGYPTYYNRKIIDVYCGGLAYQAQVYIMTEESRYDTLDLRSATSYITSIANGYNSAGIPIDQLWYAIREQKDRLKDLNGREI